MTSQGIWIVSVLVYGVLLQVSKAALGGYRLVSNGEHQYQAQHQPVETGLHGRISTSENSTLTLAIKETGDISKLIPGQEGSTRNYVIGGKRGGEQYVPLNQHQELAIAEKQYGEFDRNNTINASDIFQPITNNQSQYGELDRSNTTNASDIFQPVTNTQFQNRTTTRLHLIIVRKLNTSSDLFDEFDPASSVQIPNGTATDPGSRILDKLNKADALEEFEPKANKQTQTMPKTESQLLIFENGVHETTAKNQFKTRTVKESELEVFGRINTTDDYVETEPAEKHQVKKSTETNPLLEVIDSVNATDVFETFEPSRNIQTQNRTPVYSQRGIFERTNTSEKFDALLPEKINQDTNETPQELQLGLYDKTNSTDLYKESEPETNIQVLNSTITEPSIRVFEKNDVTNIFEESEQARSNRTLNKTATADQLHILKIINKTDVSEKTEPKANIHNQHWKETEPQLVVFGRINTSNLLKEFEPVRIYKDVVFNKSEHEQNISSDIIAEGQVLDVSLLQNQSRNWITKDPRTSTFDTINATDVSDALERISNSSGVVTNKPASKQEINNATIRFENGHLIELVKQSGTKLQWSDSRLVDNNQSTQTNVSVIIKHSLAPKQGKSKGTLQVQSNNKQSKGNAIVQTRKSKPIDQRKGQTVIRAGKVNRDSSPKPRTQNRKLSRLGTIEGVNKTNIADEFPSISNLTGNIILNQTVRYASLSPNQTENGIANKSFPGTNDRIDTTDSSGEFEQSMNSTRVAVKEHKQQMQNETLFSGHTMIDRENISDYSLSLKQTHNRTVTEPRFETLNNINATQDPERSEPVSNFTSIVVDQLELGKGIHNTTVNSTTSNDSRDMKQRAAKETAKIEAKRSEEKIRIVNKLTTKGKKAMGQGQLLSNVSKTQRNDHAKSKNYRKKGNGTMSGFVKQGNTKLLTFDSKDNRTETRVQTINILATREKDLNESVKLHSVIGKKQTNEQAKTETGIKQGNTVINPDKENNYLSTTQPHGTTLKTTPYVAYSKVNASNVTDEFKLTSNSTDVDMGQPVPAEEVNKNAFILVNTVSSLANVSDTLFTPNLTNYLTKKESSLGPFYRVKTIDDIVDLDSSGVGINGPGSDHSRKDTILSTETLNVHENVSDASLPKTEIQNQTAKETILGSFYRFNTSDNIDELTSMVISSRDSISESLSGRQIQKNALFSAHTNGSRVNDIDTPLTSKMSQNQTTEESHLWKVYQGNTTDNNEELGSMTNSTGVGIKKPESDKIPEKTLLSAQSLNNNTNVSDASLSQPETNNRTTKMTSLESVVYGFNISENIDEFKSIVNTTGGEIDDSLSVRQLKKDRLFSAHTNISRVNDIDKSMIPHVSQNQTTKDAHLGHFYRSNTTDNIDDLESMTNSTAVDINQPESDKIRENVLLSAQTLNIHESVSDASLPRPESQNRTAKETILESFDRFNTSDNIGLTSMVNSAGVDINESLSGRQIQIVALVLAHTNGSRVNDIDTPLTSKMSQNQTTEESHLWKFYQRNSTDNNEEFGSMTNSTGVGINKTESDKIRENALLSAQTLNIHENVSDASLSKPEIQNLTTKESSLEPIYRFNTSDNIDELKSIANTIGGESKDSFSGQQLQKGELFSGHIISTRVNDIDTSMIPQVSQNQTTKAAHLGKIYQGNTTDNISEYVAMTNAVGKGINEPESDKIRENVLLSAQTLNIHENVSDASLSKPEIQNLTTKESILRSPFRSNVSNNNDIKSMVNSAGDGINVSLSGQQIQKVALFSDSANVSTLTKHIVTTQQPALSVNVSVKIVSDMVRTKQDRKGQMKSHSTKRNKQVKKPTKARNMKKQEHRKGTDGRRGKT